MSIPKNRNELRERWENGERFTFLFFYGHRPSDQGVDASCFSQWFARHFIVDNIPYPTAEHWMMAEKARLFGDDEMLAAILASQTPREAKALGRKVSNFDPAIWNSHKFAIVCRGNYEKFSQHDDLKNYLLATAEFKPSLKTNSRADNEFVREKVRTYKISKSTTSDVILVEAAGRDVIWGIGLGQNNPKAKDPLNWRGQNLLGFALTEVREQINAEDAA